MLNFTFVLYRGTFPVLSINSSRLSSLAESGLRAPLSSYLEGALNKLIYIHGVRMKSSTQQKVSQLFQNCKYLPEISNSTTLTILTRDHKAVWKYS